MLKKLAVLMLVSGVAVAEPLSWDVGIGTVQLPTTIQDTKAVAGWDFVLHKGIVGGATTILQLWNGNILGDVGAVGEYPTNAPNVQPYLALGVDIKKHLPPVIANLSDLSVGAFGRYDSTVGKLGAGLSVGYAFP